MMIAPDKSESMSVADAAAGRKPVRAQVGTAPASPPAAAAAGTAARSRKSAAPAGTPGGKLPPEVEFILSALEAGAGSTPGTPERRRGDRTKYRVCASLKLYSDAEGGLPWQIFVRDVDPRGLGFLTRHRLPLGYGGLLTIVTPQGATAKIDCTLVRCREAVQGWFEGSMYFNREQGCFVVEETGAEG